MLLQKHRESFLVIPVGLFSKGPKGVRHLNRTQILHLVCKSCAGVVQKCDPLKHYFPNVSV